MLKTKESLEKIDWDYSYRFIDNLSRHSKDNNAHDIARDVSVLLTSLIGLDDLQVPEDKEYEEFEGQFKANAGWPTDMGWFEYQSQTYQFAAIAHLFSEYAMGRTESCYIGYEDYLALCEAKDQHDWRGESHYYRSKAEHYSKQLEVVIKWFRIAFCDKHPEFLFELIKEG